MGDFTELTLDTGVDDYHVNRFRIAFKPPAGISTAALVHDLIDNFPTYLKSDYATVEFGDHDHEGKRTLHFHGYAKVLGLDLAKPHDDWVVREWVDRNVGFTAQTLKREFFVAGDDLGAAAGAGLGTAVLLAVFPVAGFVVPGAVGIGGAAASAVHYNRMHFLAGRRSWRISQGTVFGLSGDVIVFETVAIERFSAGAYSTADSVLGLESKIPDVWIALLNNFVNKKGLTVVPQTLKPRWKNKARVDYLVLSFNNIVSMFADPESRDVVRLYPTILP